MTNPTSADKLCKPCYNLAGKRIPAIGHIWTTPQDYQPVCKGCLVKTVVQRGTLSNTLLEQHYAAKGVAA